MKSRLPKGMGGGPSNINALMKQAQKMQEDMTALLKSLTIKPDVVDPEDIEMLQDLVISAVNEVMRQIEEISSAEMEKITGNGGASIPGLF